MSSSPITDCIKLIIADDHELIREALSMHLLLEPDMHLVASVSNGKDLYDILASSSETIDIIIADFDMPDGGLTNLNRIKENTLILKYWY